MSSPEVAQRVVQVNYSLVNNTLFSNRNRAWIQSEKMGAFLSVSQGSAQPPVFLEIDYKEAEVEKPIALVGKGITFDR